MLGSVSSRELTELRAYEMVNGPIGSQYSEEILGDIHEQLQNLGRLLIAQTAEDADDIPPVHRYPRPWEVWEQGMGEDG